MNSYRRLSQYFDLNALFASLVALALLLICFSAKAQNNIIKADGSSTVYPVTEAVAEEFSKSKSGAIKVVVGISGTGGGFKKFCRGETDVQNASRPIQTSELEACKSSNTKFVELPIGYDALVIAVNPKNTWISQITVEELKKIWGPEAQGKITKWNQVNPAWPDAPLKLFGAGSDSGTFDYFTEAVVGKAKSSRGDYTASEDDNTLIQGISSDKNALGYVPFSYFEENRGKLKALVVVNPKTSKPINASKETVENGSYAPLSRPLFLYVSEKSLKRPEVKEFAEYYIKNAATLVQEVKYVALPAKAYALALENLKKPKLGTVFGGHSEIGLKIEDLIKKEGKL